MENDDPNNQILIETKMTEAMEKAQPNWGNLVIVTIICGFSTMNLGAAMTGSILPY